jgi:hypothetical protein
MSFDEGSNGFPGDELSSKVPPLQKNPNGSVQAVVGGILGVSFSKKTYFRGLHAVNCLTVCAEQLQKVAIDRN